MRYWLYNNEGGRLFDTSLQERERLLSVGWFDTPAKVKNGSLTDRFISDPASLKRWDLFALGGEVGAELSRDLKNQEIIQKIWSALDGNDT